MHLFTRVTLSVKMNMFGYDDNDLNKMLMTLVQNPSVMVQVTLDKSQASGPTEKAILTSDTGQDAKGFANDFAIGDSATSQISHTKGGVLDGIVAFEGSTNWSSSGEGTGISLTTAKQAPGVQGAEQHARRLREYLRDRQVRGAAGLRARRGGGPAAADSLNPPAEPAAGQRLAGR